jgi:hypothetical protein
MAPITASLSAPIAAGVVNNMAQVEIGAAVPNLCAFGNSGQMLETNQ